MMTSHISEGCVLKRFLVLLCLFSALSFLFAADNTGDWYKVSSFKKTLTVRLPSNPTTGYQWEVSLDDGLNFQKKETSFSSSKSSRNLMGAGGTYKAVFHKPMVDGTFVIQFSYRRSWETVDPIETKSLQITVKNKKIQEVKEI